MSQSDVPINPRILVVDDNRSIHDDFRKILCSSPIESDSLAVEAVSLFGEPAAFSGPTTRPVFEIDSAFQGEEGLGLGQQAVKNGRPYAMAFVDVRMPPGWDGVETAVRLWEACPDLQIVICTAYSDYSWDQMTAKLAHSDQLLILKKPFETMEVMQLASALIEKWRLQQAMRRQLDYLESQVQERTQVLQRTNVDLAKANAELSDALVKVKTLGGLLPICAQCKKIRDDKGYWNQIESFIRDHSNARFTHGICPSCSEEFRADLARRRRDELPQEN